jgi:hypothetical protein
MRGRACILGEPGGWHARRLAAGLESRGLTAPIVRWQDLRAAVALDGPRCGPPDVATADVHVRAEILVIIVYVLISVMRRVVHRIRDLEYQFVFVVTPPELLIEDDARRRYERRRQVSTDG